MEVLLILNHYHFKIYYKENKKWTKISYKFNYRFIHVQNVNICGIEDVFFSIDFFLNIHILMLLMAENTAKFSIGDVVKHRHFDFRGVIYDVDFEFNNSEEWYNQYQKM